MKRSKYTKEQIAFALEQAELGTPVPGKRTRRPMHVSWQQGSTRHAQPGSLAFKAATTASPKAGRGRVIDSAWWEAQRKRICVKR